MPLIGGFQNRKQPRNGAYMRRIKFFNKKIQNLRKFKKFRVRKYIRLTKKFIKGNSRTKLNNTESTFFAVNSIPGRKFSISQLQVEISTEVEKLGFVIFLIFDKNSESE